MVTKTRQTNLSVEDEFRGIGETEGRFGHLESEVVNLKHGQESLEQQLAEGFKAIFIRIDAMSTSRASGVMQQLALGLTFAGLFAGMIYVYMAGQTAVNGQQIGSVISDVRDIKTMTTGSLRDVNDRLYASQFDKGVLSQTIIDFRARLKEVDDKQLAATTALGLRLDERSKAIEDKIVLASSLQQKVSDAAYASKDDYAAWRVVHVKEDAYAHGKLDAWSDDLRNDTRTIEERQFLNTGKISELDWLREPGQKVRLDGDNK